MPLIGNREYAVHVVGESFYEDNLRALCGPATDHMRQFAKIAILTLESDNPYDRHSPQHHQPHRVGLLDHPKAHCQSQTLERRSDEAPLVRHRAIGSGKTIPTHQGLRVHAAADQSSRCISLTIH
jgi:hypothetical protein